jgi:hypothetical protein
MRSAPFIESPPCAPIVELPATRPVRRGRGSHLISSLPTPDAATLAFGSVRISGPSYSGIEVSGSGVWGIGLTSLMKGLQRVWRI